MRKMTSGAIVAGVLMIAAGAGAQTAGPSVEPPSRGIVPVTGPSVVPAVPEPAKPEVVPEEIRKTDGARKSAAGRPAVSKATAATPRAVKPVKAAQKPGAKTTVKKTPASTHVAKVAAPQKTKQVSVVKHPPPSRQPTVGKPIPLAKPPPPAKSPAPPPPVLPRV